jgi:hypothetical protein
MSQHRPAGIADSPVEPPIAAADIHQTRSPVRTVVIATVALSLLYIGFIRVFDPDPNIRALMLGFCLIAVTAAVYLNAFTLDALGSQAGVRNVPSARAVPGKSKGEGRDCDQTVRRSNDE